MKRTRSSAVTCTALLVFAISSCLFLFSLSSICSAAVVWEEDFESGWGAWTADNGVWQIDMPCASFGPGGPHGGLNCAGTVLCANYPAGTDSRLVSPAITLPSVSAGQELWLRFYEWFSYASNDQGYVQVSVRQPDGITWSSWTALSSFPTVSSSWSLCAIELSAYAGKVVRIAFYHTADASAGHVEGPGWYIDDVTIEKILPSLPSPEGFESGWGGWSTDHGVWQIGVPSASPGAHTGTSCAATRLNGDYPAGTDSRLISPTVTLPSVVAGEEIMLRFWEYFSYASNDQGQVQISVQQPNGSWAYWTVVSDYPSGYSTWTMCGVELTAYAGKTVRIAFYHTADASAGHVEGPGWYIDDVTIEKTLPSLPSPEGFESGWGGWRTTNGIWQIGVPTSGPGAAHTGTSCAATRLNGNYPAGTGSTLMSPTVQLPSITAGDELWISFWQWFSYASNDGGRVRIYERPPGGTWSGPVDLATVTGSSGWSRSTLEVTAYAGKEIRIAFYHTADASAGHVEGPGWYIDDLQVYAPLANTIPLAKQYPDADRAAIPGMVVTAVWPSYFYVQDDYHRPSCGLRVQWSGGGVNVGDVVNVAGPMGTRSEGERYLGATSASVVGHVQQVVPVGTIGRGVGGTDLQYNPLTGAGQMGVAAGYGLNNVGMLIRTWGKIVEIGSGFFYIDDGSAGSSLSRRVKVLGDLPQDAQVGSFVQVTGVSSCDSILFDHFAAGPLNTQLWTAVKGTPAFTTSCLTLTSTGPGTGKDVRSNDLFEGISMEIKAKSTGWKVDTSFGFEYWESTTHYGIVVTNGCLGIINQSKSAPNEVYIPIPDWSSLKGLDLIYTLRWKSDRVVLDIRDHPLSTVSYSGDLIPTRPLAIRFNASNDVADQLSIDYAKVVPQRLIRTRDESDIMPLD